MKNTYKVEPEDRGGKTKYYIFSDDTNKYLHHEGSECHSCDLTTGRWSSKEAADEFLSKWSGGKKFSMTIKEQIELAKSLKGKKIKSKFTGAVATVKDFKISPFLITDNGRAKKVIELQGCVVYLTGYWPSVGVDMNYPIGLENDIEIMEEPWETVEINGFKAEKTPTGYRFGCAAISNETLALAKSFLVASQIGDPNTNKKVVSVKIGAGEFDLDTLKKLV